MSQIRATELRETETFDLITMGRVGVDLYPLQDGVGLEDVETFGKYLGGSATTWQSPRPDTVARAP